MNRIIEDAELHIDPREFTISHYGHRSFYTSHHCPTCETTSDCNVSSICKLEHTVECLPCLTRELLEDTEKISKEAREFLKKASTPELQWEASVIDGKLKGLGERSSELMKRQDAEVKS